MSIVREDWSAIEALDQHFISRDKAAIEERLSPLRVAEKRAQSELRLKTGFAFLAAGIGIGAAAFGISFLVKPKIITTEKIVIQTQVERVEIPKIVEVTKIERVEIPKIIEKPVQLPALIPQALAKPKTEQQFTEQQAFKDAEYHGIIDSYLNGNITFRGGRTFYHSIGNVLSYRPELIGKQAYCEEFNPQEHRFHCYAWVNGKVLGI
jgi:hypothetical protein